MLLGPVFNAELMTTARRARYYVIRFLYGSIILFQIYLTFQDNQYLFSGNARQLTLREMSGFATQLFGIFAMVQAVVVLLLTPALVGGTIADERQRKTLHYLLTSQLSSAEIILGKLGARLLQVVVLVALGLPVVSLMGLFGGIDYPLLLVVYASTFSTMFFLGSASILLSVISRRPREAIMLIYLLEFVWLIVPTLLINLMPQAEEPWPTIARYVNPILEYIALTSPIYFIDPRVWVGVGMPYEEVAWGIGLQVLYGSIFVVLAALRLRPSARTEGSTSSLNRWFKAIMQKRKWLPRKPCGDDGMIWKELHVARTGGLIKVVFVILSIGLVGLIVYTGYDSFFNAWDEMSRDGYFTEGPNRTGFNYFLRSFSVGIYVLWFLGVASGAATGLCSEREEDQWITLTSTPLSGEEILRAKMIGPVWGLRYLAYLLFGLWALGLMVGSVNILSVFICLIELTIFTWFLTALGTLYSLRAKNSTRSLALTMATLIFVNGGYLFCCLPFSQNASRVITAGMTPLVFGLSVFSNQDLYRMGQSGESMGEAITSCFLCVLFYGFAATGITTSLFSIFDTVVDRPDRLRQVLTPVQRQAYLKSPKSIRWQDESP